MLLLGSFDSLRSAFVVRALGGRRKAPRHSAAGVLRIVRSGGRHLRAVAVPGATEWAARARNLHILVTLFDEAEIDYFCLRGTPGRVPVIAVPAAQRRDVHEVLRLAFDRNPGYVGQGGDATLREGGAAATWRRVADWDVLRVVWVVSDPSEHLVFAAESGCEIEFWSGEQGRLSAPRSNEVLTEFIDVGERVAAPQAMFSLIPGAYSTGMVRTLPEFTDPLPHDHLFPVDVVYTWVDDSDPVWSAEREAVRSGGQSAPLHAQAANDARFTSRDELRYSLRSLHQYAPWIRNVYLVTAGQVPRWLNADAYGIQVIDHRDIFSDPRALPTFNSHAIESQLHHIEGLSEQFLYLNDDVFLGRPVQPGHFFHPNGITKFFQSKALIPAGALGPDDLPVDAAGKNSRELMAREFGVRTAQKMKHTPHALRRSVLAEIEQVYAAQHFRTQHSRFRSPDDVPITSSLHHYYGYRTGRATVGGLRYTYIDLAADLAQKRLDQLRAQRNFDTFCLNDTVEHPDPAAQERMVRDFLEAYFPVPSRFEDAVAEDRPVPARQRRALKVSSR
ncbi:stealth family protein [Streptomyces sp. NBC_01280]|uniref:stealth family protein n=1 Tax=unclassified Streptomyces TaxID=2593676 RepID=UPI002E359EBE|nr:stealth family protein [Streptomyces sp. NBC_01280]WSE17807.1 stealth family protein [Streptomyces sp. NBC_01397]